MNIKLPADLAAALAEAGYVLEYEPDERSAFIAPETEPSFRYAYIIFERSHAELYPGGRARIKGTLAYDDYEGGVEEVVRLVCMELLLGELD